MQGYRSRRVLLATLFTAPQDYVLGATITADASPSISGLSAGPRRSGRGHALGHYIPAFLRILVTRRDRKVEQHARARNEWNLPQTSEPFSA